MATIGTFTRSNETGSFTGAVKTLSINVKTTIKPADKTNERAPDYRILTGSSVEFGAAWKKISGEGREYLSVKLDDPSFPAPIYATLVEAEEPNTFRPHLVPPQRRLSRPTRPCTRTVWGLFSVPPAKQEPGQKDERKKSLLVRAYRRPRSARVNTALRAPSRRLRPARCARAKPRALQGSAPPPPQPGPTRAHASVLTRSEGRMSR